MDKTTSFVPADSRQLEEHEAKRDTLRLALIEGENSGAASELDFDAFIVHRRLTASDKFDN